MSSFFCIKFFLLTLDDDGDDDDDDDDDGDNDELFLLNCLTEERHLVLFLAGSLSRTRVVITDNHYTAMKHVSQ